MTDTLPSPPSHIRESILSETRDHINSGRYCDALTALETARGKIEELAGRIYIEGGDFSVTVGAKNAF